jgi:hypothetical protein
MASRLVEFKITGLFGLYDHRIELKLKDRITIIIGPNGRGKTVCLKFIEALFRNRHSYFGEIPFRTADFVFAGGQKITLVRSEEMDSPDEQSDIRGLLLPIPRARDAAVADMSVAAIDQNLAGLLRRFRELPCWRGR